MLADKVLQEIQDELDNKISGKWVRVSKARMQLWRDWLTRDAQQRTGAERGAGSDKPASASEQPEPSKE